MEHPEDDAIAATVNPEPAGQNLQLHCVASTGSLFCQDLAKEQQRTEKEARLWMSNHFKSAQWYYKSASVLYTGANALSGLQTEPAS